jgi:FAD/FMN-containing dehydrogenase
MNWSLQDLRGILPDNSIDLSTRNPVVTPENPRQMLELVQLASARQFKICPAGTISQLETADLPENCIVVSSRMMNRMTDFSPDDLHMTFESGFRFNEIKNATSSNGLAVACEALSYDGSLGGALSLGISSDSPDNPISVGHCVTAASVVMPYGKLVRVGAVTLKSVAGYDVSRFLAGSRGRFGLIVSVTLRLTPRSQVIALNERVPVNAPTVRPSWHHNDSHRSAIEKNLKSNLDPAGIFPD